MLIPVAVLVMGIRQGWKALMGGGIMVFGIRVLTGGRVRKEARVMGGLLGTECGIMRCGGMYLVGGAGFPMGGRAVEGEATVGVRGSVGRRRALCVWRWGCHFLSACWANVCKLEKEFKEY